MTEMLSRTEFRGIVRSRRIRHVLLPRDGRRVHKLRQERLQPHRTRLQEGHRRQEHLDPELGHVPQGKTQLLTPRRIPILLQRDT